MRIIVFYSFKGGVGRTALCVNLGVYLARQGASVLLVDWDLRAPGLSAYPDFQLSAETPGIADFLNAAAEELEPVRNTYKPGNPEDHWAETERMLRKASREFLPSRLIAPAPRDLLRKLRPPRATSLAAAAKQRPGHLYVIPAGTREALRLYREEPMRDLAWRAALARFVRSELSGKRQKRKLDNGETINWPAFDFVFIDAQAGEAATSLLPREQLFDSHLFLVGGLNRQNREGLLQVLEEMTQPEPAPPDDPFGGRQIPLDHLPTFVSVVLSPVPDSADDAPERCIEKFHEGIRTRVLKPRRNVPEEWEAPPRIFRLPYTRALALGEEILALTREASTYIDRLGEIAKHPVLKPENPSPGYDKLAPPPIHPIADLPAWTWMIPNRNAQETLRTALQTDPEDDLSEQSLSRLFNIVWWDAGLSNDGLSRILTSLQERNSRKDMLSRLQDGIDADRVQQLWTPRSDWANQIGEVLDATFRFGTWLYQRIGAGNFRDWFLEQTKDKAGLLKSTRWESFPPFWFYVSEVAAVEQRYPLAIELAREAVRLNPVHVRSRMRLIVHLIHANEHGKALIQAQELEERFPADYEICLALGEILTDNLLDVPRGLALLNRALEWTHTKREIISDALPLLSRSALISGDVELIRKLTQRGLVLCEEDPAWLPPLALLLGMLFFDVQREQILTLVDRFEQSGGEQVRLNALEIRELMRMHRGELPSEEIMEEIARGRFGSLEKSPEYLWFNAAGGQLDAATTLGVLRHSLGRSQYAETIPAALAYLDSLNFVRLGLEKVLGIDKVAEIHSLLCSSIGKGLKAIQAQTGRRFSPRLEALLSGSSAP